MSNERAHCGRIAYIDGLRGVFALIVVICHFKDGFLPKASLSMLSFLYNGGFAVCGFFVISSLVASKTFYFDSQRICKTATTRYFRLCIPVTMSILINYLFISLSLFSNVEAAAITKTEWLNNLFIYASPDFGQMLKSALFRVFFIGDSSFNLVLWMMSILFYGSFLTFCILKLWGSMRNRWVVYLAFIMIFFEFSKGNVLNLYYISFVLGIIIADLTTNYSLEKRIQEKHLVLFGVTMILLGIYIVNGMSSLLEKNIGIRDMIKRPDIIYTILGSFCCILGISYVDFAKKILVIPVFQYLGKISFSIFLIHLLVLASYSSNLFAESFQLTQRYNLSFFITVVTSIPIILVLAHLFYKYVEEPSNRLISDLYDKYFY